jgi:uncharacterized protein YprB with RNaseH-like and TPR domain
LGLFSRLAELWKSKDEKNYDAEVKKDIGTPKLLEADPIYQDPIFSNPRPAVFSHGNEEEQTKHLLQKLLDKYKGTTLEQICPQGLLHVIDGESCFHIQSENQGLFARPCGELCRDYVMSNLKLIRGIGPHYEMKLKTEGYNTLSDLIEHSRYGSSAQEIVSLFDEDPCDMVDCVSGLVQSASDPSVLALSGLIDEKDLLFMDIETLGLAGVPLILIGVGEMSEGIITVNQYLLRDIKEEYAALQSYLIHLRSKKALFTYNGKSFDVPFIDGRFAYNGIPEAHDITHFDLMHFCRRRWKDSLPDCKLKTIEAHLVGAERDDDVPGAYVPHFYDTYLREGNPGPLVPIIEHNRLDVVHLANIYSYLCKEWFNVKS